MSGYYETDDDLTLEQAEFFMKCVDTDIGVDMELNESPSGEANRYYIMVIDLEGDHEYDLCSLAEGLARSTR